MANLVFQIRWTEKMTWIYGLLFTICGIYAQDVEQVGSSPVQQFFQNRCYKNAKDGEAYDQLVGLSYEFYRYAQYTATFLPSHIDHFCKNEKPILTLKLKDVNKQMLKCLPQEEKFLPQYVQNIFTDFMDFLCEREGANVKTFFSSHGKQCRDTMSSNNASQEVSTCFAKVFTTVGDRGYVTKDVMCRDVGLVKGCFIGLLDKYCRDFAAFTELNKQFFAHISKPCAACIFGINNVVAFSSVLTALIWGKLFHL